MQMSVAAYGMLLHSYRWKLHFRVATVMTEEGTHSNMVLAHHWLQVTCAIDIDWMVLFRRGSRMTVGACAMLMCTGAAVYCRCFRQTGPDAEQRLAILLLCLTLRWPWGAQAPQRLKSLGGMKPAESFCIR